ncbi:hypothetical protein K7432_011038 [Basidiobolus ranarum]|uniref:EF-hand domain-containing protein n=1 Tax=Basidiobolus ranarum TaxID=34480 RepID=A0ABR2VUJ5_9FUNG
MAAPQQQQLQAWFQAVDVDHSGGISADELQKALLNGDWSPFNIETVRMMINMFDRDDNGTINYQEFCGLWKYIEDWKRCFMGFDKDQSGSIDQNELKNAMITFGYNLSDKFLSMMIRKYDKKGTGNITFDNFIQVSVTVRTLTDSFRRFDTDSDGWVTINYEQFMELVVSSR